MGAHHSRLLGGDSDEPHVCPTHDLSENPPSPLFGTTSFFDFNKILSGSCAAFACFVVLIHLIRHATHFSNPGQQSKVMRIALLLPLYSALSFLSICFPRAKVYLLPWLDVFQATVLASFFLLMGEFVSPIPEQRDVFFAALRVKEKKSPDGTRDGLAWYRKAYVFVFQYPVVAVLAAVATDLTEAAGVYCQYETKLYFAKIWITIVRDVSLVLAALTLIRFVLILKSHLQGQQPMAKLIAFKLIVMLNFVQTILWLILDAAHALNPTSTLTYADLYMGIPSMLNCIEMVPISLLLMKAYSLSPYLLTRSLRHATVETGVPLDFPRSYQGGLLGMRAFAAMLSPKDLLRGLAFAFRVGTAGKDESGYELSSQSGYRPTEYNPAGYGHHRAEYNPLVEPYATARC